MPITIFWGEDDYLIQRHVNKLKTKVLDPAWEAFNFSQYSPGAESIANAIADILTSPLGKGGRLVLLPNSSWFAAMDEQILKQVSLAIASMQSTNFLLLTSHKKPDGRLKSTKLLMQSSQEVREFSLISPWDAAALVQRVLSVAQFLNLKITPTAAENLANAIGNNTRLLFSELEKLGTYTNGDLIETSAVKALVDASAQTSLGLAKAILARDRDAALRIWADLQSQNQPPLKILTALTTMFRQWLWVKAWVSEGQQNNQAIKLGSRQSVVDSRFHLTQSSDPLPFASGLTNPGRVHYLKQEVALVSLTRLQQTQKVLLDWEVALKSSPASTPSQVYLLQLCQ